MKTGSSNLRHVFALALLLSPLAVSAQMYKVSATFTTGDEDASGADTQLQSADYRQGDIALPDKPYAAPNAYQQPVANSADSTADTDSNAAEPAAEPAEQPYSPPASYSEATPQTASAESAAYAEPVTSSAPTLDSQAHWQIRNGERISDVFNRWAATVSWQTTWEPEDLVALADLELDDSFTGAIGKIVDALNRQGADIKVQFYTTNRMLRVMARK